MTRPIKKKKVVKPDLCIQFGCKDIAVKAGLCQRHGLTVEDFIFLQRLNDLNWMVNKGVPALKKLAKKYPQYIKSKG